MGTHLPLALQSPPDPEDEGEVIITAEMLCASAARWRSTVRELESSKLIWVRQHGQRGLARGPPKGRT